MGRVGLGLGWTHTQPNWIGWTENGLADEQIFGSEPVARAFGWVGRIHQVISGLKEKHNTQSEMNQTLQPQKSKNFDLQQPNTVLPVSSHMKKAKKQKI